MWTGWGKAPPEWEEYDLGPKPSLGQRRGGQG